jgi:hypothetical protein
MRAPRLLLVLGMVAMPLVLAACGDSNDNSADEDQITAVITRAATSGDPAVCTQDQTLKFTEQTSGGAKGQAAVKSCEQDAKDTAAEKIDVTDVKVDGDTATATAKATGSIFDQQTIEIALVKDGDQWKLDEFKGFEDFNKDAFIAASAKQFQAEGVSQQAINCVTQQFQKASDADIEAAFIGSDPQAQDRLFRPCSKYFQG